MNDDTSALPARDIAISLMRSALVLMDHVREGAVAAALQSAIDIAEEKQSADPV